MWQHGSNGEAAVKTDEDAGKFLPSVSLDT